ncbi:MAG: imidazole glycerol phosphate synthase subunit HisH [Spirochaetia bacterium]|jgi:glutamine amidotransferase|nr:imidazole glycerol phosphate synthase subunit HisH [Spirochaetia bacterium]
MITVIDYGMGNIRSVVKAFELYTKDVQVSNDPSSIKKSSALILPGDGAFAMAMENLKKLGWAEPLKKYIEDGGYFFGVCLGYQLLFSSSEEFGCSDGLGIIEGHITRFPKNALKVPHMGWNSVKFTGTSAFLDGLPDNSYFYFIHSYYPETASRDCVLGEAEYGINFPCIIGRGKLIATQFHPEKSHRCGLMIVENFVRRVCS